jgi:PAS domain S-box-containing protein
MRNWRARYSSLAGIAISVIGLLGIIGQAGDIHGLTSFLPHSAGQEIALSTSIAMLFLGAGIFFTLGNRTSKSRILTALYQQPAWIMSVPVSISFYYILSYLILSGSHPLRPLFQNYPTIPMTFVTAIQLFLTSGALLLHARCRSSWWACAGLGIIGIFLLQAAIFAIVGHWMPIPVLFSFIQALPTAIAFVLAGSAFLVGTIDHNGILATVISPVKKIRILSLLSILTSLLILMAGLVITTLFQKILNPDLSRIWVSELYLCFEYSTIILSTLVTALALRVVFFFETSLQAEKEARASEERFRLLVATVQDYAIYGLDLEGKVTSWNEGAERITGYRADEIIGMHFSRFYPEDEVSNNLPQRQLAMTTAESSIETQGWRIKRDGSRFWARSSLTSIRNADGALMGFSSIIQDLTRQKQMEDSLHASLDELTNVRKAIDAAANVAITDSNGVITYVNDAFCAMSGYSREELIGQTHRVVNSDYHPPEFFQALWETIGTGRIWKGELRNRTKTGQIYWADTTIYPFLNGGERPVRYIAIQHNITPLKTAQESLKANAYRQKILSTLSQHALTGMNINTLMAHAAILTAQGLKVPLCHVLELLPSGKEFLLKAAYGWEEGLVGTMLIPAGADSQAGFTLLMDEPVIVDDFRTEERFNKSALLQTHPIISGLSVIIHGETPERPFGVLSVHTYTARHFKPDDITFLQAVANIIAIAIERKHAESLLRQFNEELEKRVTERTCELEEAKREAEEANRMKTRILAFVSHDFKNPLAAIGRFTQILEQQNHNLTPYQQELIRYISDGVTQLRVMVTDILDKARLEEGQMTISLEWVELTPLLEELMPVMKSLAAEKQVTLTCEVQPGLTGIEADPRSLRQIILNLVSNAIKYNKPGGEAVLRFSETADRPFAVIEVQDTGIGIPPDKLPDLFKEYYRVGSASYDKVEGTGLGLAYTKKLIDLHGGQILASSQVGIGSIFTVLLPTRHPVTAPQTALSPTAD